MSPLARVRTAEMEAALAVLGVTDHVWLDYPDGGVADVDPAEGTARVLEQIRRTRPDTILTFGPDGMTGHTDHIAVSEWVDLAVQQYDGPAPAVLHATNTPEWLDRWRPTLDEANVYMGGEPPCHPLAEHKSAHRADARRSATARSRRWSARSARSSRCWTCSARTPSRRRSARSRSSDASA